MDLFTRILSYFSSSKSATSTPSPEQPLQGSSKQKKNAISETRSNTGFTFSGHKYHGYETLLAHPTFMILSCIPVRDDPYNVVSNAQLSKIFAEQYERALSSNPDLAQISLYESTGNSLQTRSAKGALTLPTFYTDSDSANLHQYNYGATPQDLTDAYFEQVVVKAGIGSPFIEVRQTRQDTQATTKDHFDYSYIIDLSFLEQYAVRPGYIPYGGTLYLTKSLAPIAIKYMGRTYYKYAKTELDELAWMKAKILFLSSLVVHSTIWLHAYTGHLVYGSRYPHLLQSTCLPESPFRRLMIPFTFDNFRTASLARNVLFGKNKYFHRLFAFENETLTRYCQNMQDHKQQRFMSNVFAFVDITEHSAFYSDVFDYGCLVHEYVSGFLKDVTSTEFDRLAEVFDLPVTDTETSATNVLNFFVEWILFETCIHEVIGNSILLYVHNPKWVSIKLRKIAFAGVLQTTDILQNRCAPDSQAPILDATGSQIGQVQRIEFETGPDLQTFLQTIFIGIETSLARLPKMMDLPSLCKPLYGQDEMELVYSFVDKLRQLANENNYKNIHRAFPFNGANPERLETSMSV